MASNYTANYGLSQWERTDKVQMEDFNEDNAKIDTALAALAAGTPKIKCSWYWGDGKASQRIALGFVPSAVFLFCSDPPSRSSGCLYGGIAVIGSWPQIRSGSTTYDGFKVNQDGFMVWENAEVGVHCNMKDVEYAYVAIKVE